MSGLELTWLGQASFLVRTPQAVVALDLFLSPSERRRYPPPSHDVVPRDVSWFLCSHMHGDHFDAPALSELSQEREVRVLVPEEAAERAAAQLPRAVVRGIRPGETTDLGGLSVSAVAVVHGDEPADAYREGPYLGYLLRAPGCPALLHTGDAIPSEGLIQAARELRPEILLLPINGRDWYREREGFVGNMDAGEAARFAVAAGASIVVPMHYDAIEGNTADPADLVRHVRALGAEIAVLVPARNRPIAVGRASR